MSINFRFKQWLNFTPEYRSHESISSKHSFNSVRGKQCVGGGFGIFLLFARWLLSVEVVRLDPGFSRIFRFSLLRPCSEIIEVKRQVTQMCWWNLWVTSCWHLSRHVGLELKLFGYFISSRANVLSECGVAVTRYKKADIVCVPLPSMRL